MEMNHQTVADLPAAVTTRIAETSKIYPNVRLGNNVSIGDFCIIGYPPNGVAPGELETVIGDGTVIRSHTVIYAGVVLGEHCHLSHSVFIREHTKVGPRCSIGTNVLLEHHIVLGKNVRIQGQAGLCEHTIVEDNAWIGPRVVTANVLHPTCERAKECLSGPVIRQGAIIGANACIGPDLEVGPRAFIGSGCVVHKSIPAEAVMVGNPAKKVANVGELSCRYDMMRGESPYPEVKPLKTEKIPLVDLAKQHQSLKQEIRLAIDTVILNTRFINAVEVKEFETAFAAFCGVPHAIGVGNGTDGLALALRGLGIGNGDEVITTPHTFIATAEAILAVGATPVFADIDPKTFNIDPSRVAEKITHRTKAVIPVHLYGRPAPMEELASLADTYHLKVIEDAAQAHGAELAGRRVGQWGDAACFSFYPGKNLGAYGDAGAVVTKDPALADRIRMLRDHGRLNKYEHLIVGENSRLDSIQAAVLGVKLPQLAKWNRSRIRLAGLYRDGLTGLPVICPSDLSNGIQVFHLFVIRLGERDRLQQHLKALDIDTGIHYPVPLHLQPALKSLSYKKGDFPVTELVASEILSLPMFPELTDPQVERVLHGVRSFFA